jgi:3-oxoacyl-[acyl-carrier protein] reductase
MWMKKESLNGKVAIVTGAGRGIGRAIALAYARIGAAVGCAARTKSEIEDTSGLIKAAGEQSEAVQTDVTNLESVENLFKTIASQFGGIDILVNAGAN